MPRQIDLTPQNLQVNNNPNTQLGITQEQLASVNDGIPAALEAAEKVFITSVLTAIDNATGLDLVDWAADLENLFTGNGGSGDLLTWFTSWLTALQTDFLNFGAALQQSWISFQGVVNGVVGEIDSDWSDLVTALNATADNASSATADWTTVFEDLGLPEATAAGFATYITAFSTDINDIFGAFASGGTSAEFITGVDNLLNLFGLDATSLGSATDLTAFWTAIVNDIITPLNLLVTQADATYTALQTDMSDILGAFSSGGTSSEFVTGVENLLALVGLSNTTLGSATDLTTLWTTIVTDFINPLNAIETEASNIVGDIEQSAVSGLTDIWNWLTGTTTPTSTTQIQATAVSGTGGLADLVSAVEAGWDQLVQAFTGTGTTGNSLGQLANAAAGTSSTASNANAVAQAAAMTQAQQVAAKAAWTAFGDVTADVTFPVGPTYSLSSMPTISVTSSNSAIGYIVTPDNVDKLSVLFVAETVGTVTGVYINVYSVGAGGLCTNVIAGSNIVSEIGTLEGVIYDDFSSALTVTPGDQYAVEVVVTGSGSLTMMGLGSSWAPINSAVQLSAVGAKRSIVPTFDSVGAGTFTNSGSTSFSWTHVIGASANTSLIGFAANNAPSSVKVGTVSATLVSSKSGVGILSTYLYKVNSSLPTGSQTVTITFSAASNCNGNSVTYSGVTGFGTAATASGSSSPSLSVASAAGQVAVAVICDTSSISAFSQTSRWNNGSIAFGVMGDAAGTSSVSFTASASSTWAAVGVSLQGASPTTPPTTFTPTNSTSVPLFGLSANGGITVPIFAPETWSEYSHGSHTYSVPTWMVAGNHFDIAVLGAGQGGEGGGLTSGDWGDGGAAGSWTLRTLTYGTDIPTSTKTFSVTVGAGGTGGTPNAAGASGGSSTVTITGYGSSPITAAGGSSAEGLDGSWVGASPGNQTINDTYYGGGTQNSESSPGQSPGGGGGGGHGFAGSGGNGADAAVFIRAYQ